MRPEDVLQFLRKRPFQPSRIFLTDGTMYEITHPELAMVGRSSVLIGQKAPDEPNPVFDDFVFVALLHINRIEPIGASAPTASN